MKIIYLTFTLLLFISGLAIANVPAPPPPNSKGIELTRDYPDFVFYFGKYYVFQEKGKSIRKIDLETIQLTDLIPFPIKQPKDLDLEYFKENNINASQVKFSVREDYLIAVKKEIHDQVKPKLSLKMIDLINLKKDGDGIYFAPVPEVGETTRNSLYYGRFAQRMVVEKLDENGLVFQVVRFQDGDNHYVGEKEGKEKEFERNFRTTAVLVGIISGFVAVITAIGIYFFRRKRKIQ